MFLAGDLEKCWIWSSAISKQNFLPTEMANLTVILDMSYNFGQAYL